MRIILAPNSFRDSLDASTAASAMASGVYRALSDADVVLLPLADGGDGTLTTMVRLLGAKLHTVTVRDPRNRPVTAHFAITTDRTTAIIETAEASGVRLVAVSDRDPFHSSTYGTGELIRAALDLGVTRILLGTGGVATIDVGAGALAALGAIFHDASDHLLDPTPAGLITLANVDLSNLDSRLASTNITVLSDVSTPLSSNATVYGHQKGIRPETARQLDQVVQMLAALAERRGYDILEAPWMGSGGGLVGGLVAFAGASATGGAKFISQLAQLPELLVSADLLLTGEGRFDATSFHGKLPIVAATMAIERGIPAVIIAGQVVWERLASLPEGVTCFSSVPGPITLQEALSSAPIYVAAAAEQIVRLYATVRKGVK